MNEHPHFDNFGRCEAVDFPYDAIDVKPNAHSPHPSPEDSRKELQTAVIRLLALIRDSTNHRLQIDVICAAFGLNLIEGATYKQLADRHGITKQAFSKRVLRMQETFALPQTRVQKGSEVRETLRHAQLAHYRSLSKN